MGLEGEVVIGMCIMTIHEVFEHCLGFEVANIKLRH